MYSFFRRRRGKIILWICVRGIKDVVFVVGLLFFLLEYYIFACVMLFILVSCACMVGVSYTFCFMLLWTYGATAVRVGGLC